MHWVSASLQEDCTLVLVGAKCVYCPLLRVVTPLVSLSPPPGCPYVTAK